MTRSACSRWVARALGDSKKQRNLFPLRTVRSLKFSPCLWILLTALGFLISVPLCSLNLTFLQESCVYLPWPSESWWEAGNPSPWISVQQMLALLGRDLINDVYIRKLDFNILSLMSIITDRVLSPQLKYKSKQVMCTQFKVLTNSSFRTKPQSWKLTCVSRLTCTGLQPCQVEMLTHIKTPRTGILWNSQDKHPQIFFTDC